MTESLTLKQRIEHIIDYAYVLFCNQVAGGGIHIDNEASMQLHLSNIRLQLERLNVLSPDEHFDIVLEKKILLDSPTCKSKNKKARVSLSRQYPPIKWDRYGKYNFLRITPHII